MGVERRKREGVEWILVHERISLSGPSSFCDRGYMGGEGEGGGGVRRDYFGAKGEDET